MFETTMSNKRRRKCCPYGHDLKDFRTEQHLNNLCFQVDASYMNKAPNTLICASCSSRIHADQCSSLCQSCSYYLCTLCAKKPYSPSSTMDMNMDMDMDDNGNVVENDNQFNLRRKFRSSHSESNTSFPPFKLTPTLWTSSPPTTTTTADSSLSSPLSLSSSSNSPTSASVFVHPNTNTNTNERHNTQLPNYNLTPRVPEHLYPNPSIYGWTFTGYNSLHCIEYYEKMTEKGLVLLDFHCQIGTVRTVLQHPYFGSTPLFMKTRQLLPEVFCKILQNPCGITDFKYLRRL